MAAPQPSSPTSSGRRRTSPEERWAIRAIALAAGIGGALAGTESTGWIGSDAVAAALACAALTYACSYARRITWFVLAGATALVSSGTIGLLAAASTVATTVYGSLAGRRSRVTGALVGALASQSLIRLSFDTIYLATLVAVVICVPTFVSAWRNAPRRARRPVWIGGAVLAVVGVVFTVVFALSALAARSDVRAAIELIGDGLEAAQDDEPERAVELLSTAAARFERANDRLSAPWAVPARLFPVIGPNAEALSVATAEGADLTRTAADTAAVVDLDTLSFSGGRIDLAELRRIDQPLDRAAGATESAMVATAEADSPWLVGPIDARFEELETELADAAPDLRNAADLVRVAPELLGADDDRRYLVLFFTPSELRGLGGFIGAFAELRASDGVITLERTGRPAELNAVLRSGNPTLTGPADYVELWGRLAPQEFFQDISLSPHFPSVASVAQQLYPQAGGAPVDGVIAVDPTTLAALTELTGPVEIDARRFGPETLADYLLHEQYVEFSDADIDRQDALDVALDEVFTALLEIDAPSPRRVADVLGPPVDGGRFMVWNDDPEIQTVMTDIGVAGGFPSPEAGGAVIGVVSQNGANNKIDYFLEREITYDVDIDDGLATGTITIEMTNTAPATGLPDAVIGSNDRGLELGLNRSAVSVYTTHRLVSATVDGAATTTRIGTEAGMNVYGVTLDLSAGETRRLQLVIEGIAEADDGFHLTIAPQPMVTTDIYNVRITGSSGEWTSSAALDADTTYVAVVE